MKSYSGILERVGNGSWAKGMTKISVLKIGNRMISNVGAEDRMYSFLDEGKDMTIYIHRYMLLGKIIIGVNHRGGDKISIQLRTVLFYIFTISFVWLFVGPLLWLALGALFSWLTCPPSGTVSNDIFDACMDRSMWVAGLMSGGLYLFFIFSLVKDYLLVKTLTLLSK